VVSIKKPCLEHVFQGIDAQKSSYPTTSGVLPFGRELSQGV
jgi:hypothetical protein